MQYNTVYCVVCLSIKELLLQTPLKSCDNNKPASLFTGIPLKKMNKIQ